MRELCEQAALRQKMAQEEVEGLEQGGGKRTLQEIAVAPGTSDADPGGPASDQKSAETQPASGFSPLPLTSFACGPAESAAVARTTHPR